MKLTRLLAATAILMALTVPAFAATDIGNGRCLQSDGLIGIWNNTTGDDAGCITETEYAETWTVENMVEAGVFTDNGDGSLTATSTGAVISVEADPLDRPAAATAGVDAPRTVRDVFARPAFGVHPI